MRKRCKRKIKGNDNTINIINFRHAFFLSTIQQPIDMKVNVSDLKFRLELGMY